MGQTLIEVVKENLARHGEKDFLCLEFAGRQPEVYSYSRVMARAQGRCRRYRELGAEPGDVIAIMLHHGVDLYCAFLGAVWAGCVPTMYPVKSEKFSATYLDVVLGGLFANSRPKVVVTDEGLSQSLRMHAHAEVHGFSVLVIESAGVVECEGVDSAVVSPTSAVFLQYSSGTTGAKKGVVVSNEALLKQVASYADAIGVEEDDHVVSWLPLYHDMGLVAVFMMSVIYAVSVTAFCPFDWIRNPGMLMRAIARRDRVYCWLPNFAFEVLSGVAVGDAELDGIRLDRVKALVNCSEPLVASTRRRFVERYQQYGLSESAMSACYALAENTFAVTSSLGGQGMVDCVDAVALKKWSRAEPYTGASAQHPRYLLGSGCPVRGAKVRIRGANGERLEDRSVGEILISSDSLFSGYYNNPELTEAVFEGQWYRTGDLGYVVDEQLFVLGRINDMLVIKGENYYPQDIEKVVGDVPGVIPGRVVCFTIEDEQKGSNGVVVVAETRGEAESSRSIVERVVGDLRERVAVDVWDVLIVPERWLIKSTSGKISRSTNRARYIEFRDERLAKVRAACMRAYPGDSRRQDVCRSVVRLVAGAVQYSAEADDIIGADLISGSLVDSLGIVGLATALEDEFDFRLDQAVDLGWKNFTSVRSIVDLVHRKTNPDDVEPADGASSVRRLAKQGSVRDDKSVFYISSERNQELLIIGSSTSWPLSTRLAEECGFSAFNFSVESANAEDWYCITRFVFDRAVRLPRMVVLGIDIEAFSDFNPIDPRLEKCSFLNPYLEPGGDKEAGPSADEGVEEDRIKMMLRSLRSFDTEKLDGYEYGFHEKSGDFVYLSDEPQLRKFNQRRPMALADPKDRDQLYLLRYQGFSGLSQKRISYFHEMLTCCRDRGVSVRIFIPPIHRDLRRFLSENTTYLDRKREFLSVVADVTRASEAEIALYDYSDVRDFNGHSADFRNAAHAGAYNCSLILRELLYDAGGNQACFPERVKSC